MHVSSRRHFLTTAAASCAACALAKCFTINQEPTFTASAADLSGQARFPLASVPSLGKSGGAVTVSASGFIDNVLVMHLADGSFAAVSSTCTHAGCAVSFRPDEQIVQCPCHGARYSLEGVVLRPPAEIALRHVLATHDPSSGDIILDYFSGVLAGVVDGQISLLAVDAGGVQSKGGQLTYHPQGFTGPLAIINIDGSTAAALAGSCTFGDCLLTYDSRSQHMTCPCHGCAFDLTGTVVTGPATAALASYPTTFDGKTFVITVREER